MREVFKRYLDYLKAEQGASDYTLRNYRTDLMGTFKRGPGKGFFQFLRLRRITDFKDVDKAILRDYMAWLMEQGIDKTSISRKLSAIRSFYRFLLKEEILEKSPIPVDRSRRQGGRTAMAPKLEKKLPVFLTVQEMVALLKTPDLTKPEGMRDRALMEIMYAGGLRISEIWQLNLENINLESREIRVTGKGNKERVVLIGLPAVEALSQYLKKARPRLLKTGLTNALWVNKTGNRLSIRGMQKQLKHYALANGIEKNVHPHVLRHTFATHMLDGGADLRVVQELLGHADLSSTQIYTHVTQQQARKVYLTAHPMAREEDTKNASSKQN